MNSTFLRGTGMRCLAVLALFGGLSLPATLGCLAPPPYARIAPSSVAGLKVYVDPAAKVTVPPSLDRDAFAASLSRGVADALTQVGFRVVTDPKLPHDLRATVSADVQRSGNSLSGVAVVALENHGVVIDSVRYDSGEAPGKVTYTNYVSITAPSLANLAAHSKRVKKFAKNPQRAPMTSS